MNRDGSAQAHDRLFENCRLYVGGEILILRPDIIVTQGDYAKLAIESSFPFSVTGDMKRCGHAVLDVQERKVLWFHTYHPRAFGGFNRQRRECFREWADLVLRFVRAAEHS
jgi:uracil-DNA glycosylase